MFTYVNLSKMFIAIIFFLPQIFSQNCLLPEISNEELCLYCRARFYNKNLDGAEIFPSSNCIGKEIKASEIRKVFISPLSITATKLSNLKQYFTIYENIPEAFYREDLIANAIREEDENKKIIFKFLKGDHFIFPKDISKVSSTFFTRNKVEIEMSPLFCYEAPIEMGLDLCYSQDAITKVYVKTRDFFVFVSLGLSIENILFNGVDISLSENNDECANLGKICCEFNSANLACVSTLKNKVTIDTENLRGIFNLEPVFDDEPAIVPLLSMKNVSFEMLDYSVIAKAVSTAKLAYNLILIWDFQGKLFFENCNFRRIFFAGGLIQKVSGIRQIYKNLPEGNGFLNAYDPLNSEINIMNCTISEYNFLGRIANFAFAPELPQKAFLFSLNNFRGNFAIIETKILSCFVPNDGLIAVENKIDLGFGGNIVIKNNFFAENIFSYFIVLTDNYSRLCLSALLADNNFMGNDLTNFIELKHVKNFTLKQEFSYPFRLPLSSFIKAAHSIMTLINCQFSGFYGIIPYPLVLITSTYQTPYDNVFNLAKRTKGKFYSNESTTFMNFALRNSTVLLFQNKNFNYLLTFQNVLFEDLFLDDNGQKPFIDLVSEGLFLINNVTFSRISTKIHVMALAPFIRVSINFLTLMNLSIKDAHVFRFYSDSTCNPNEHQLNFTNLIANSISMDLSNYNFGKFLVSVLYSHSTEAGKCACAWLEDVLVTNIFYNKPHIRHQIIHLDSSLVKFKNFSCFNFSNSVVFNYAPQVTSGELIIETMIVGNPKGYPILNFFECRLANYARVVLNNSFFTSFNISSNKAVAINLAQKVVIENTTIRAFLPAGTILFAQANSISSIYIYKLNISSFPGSEGTLLTIITEVPENSFPWANTTNIERGILNGSYLFGIKNSVFQSSYESAIVLLVQTQLLFIGCSIIDTTGKEGAAIKITQNSKAVFLKSNFTNSNAQNMGGCFSVENSALILIEVNIRNSSSLSRGGCINAVDSDLKLDKVLIINSSSLTGGVLFADTCVLSIGRSTFRDSYAKKYGAHLVSKQGRLNISLSLFEKGIAGFFGGAFYLESTVFDIYTTDFSMCRTKIGTIYAINGISNLTSTLMKVRFVNNSAEDMAASLFCSDVSISASILDIINNVCPEGFLINVIGSFLFPLLNINTARLSGNTASSGLFSLNEAEIILSNGYLSNNSVGNDKLFHLTKSVLIINNSFILQSRNSLEYSNKNNFLAVARLSNVYINSSFISMRNTSGFVYCSACPAIITFKIFITGGVSQDGPGFKLFDSNIFSSLLYAKQNQASQGGVIYSSNSSVQIELSCFSENVAVQSGSDIFSFSLTQSSKEFLKIYNCLFFKVTGTSVSAYGFSIIYYSTAVFGKADSLKTQALLARNFDTLRLDGCFFQFFSNASAIQLENERQVKSSIIVLSSIFSNATVTSGNGAFLNISGNNYLKIVKSQFLYGTAKKGGAIFIHCQTCLAEFSECSLINNRALDSGGAISSETTDVFLNETKFMNNEAHIGENINFFPSMFKFLKFNKDINDKRKEIMNYLNNISEPSVSIFENDTIAIVPGYPFSFGFLILDKWENLQLNENNTFATMNVIQQTPVEGLGQDRIHFLTNNLAKVIDGIGVFEGIILTGNTNVEIQTAVSYSNSRFKINHVFNIKVKRCNRGDSFQDFRCSRCPEQFYSLEEYPEKSKMPCEECPENAHCPGGDILIPHTKYWRKDSFSPLIFVCKMPQGCPAQELSEFMKENPFVYSCSEGYEGNICQACSKGYGLVMEMCIKCESTKIFFPLLMLSGVLIYFIVLHIEENRSIEMSDDDSVPIIKILVNHLSVFIILTSMKVNWSEFFKKFLTVSSLYISTSPSTIFSFECFFEWDKEEKIFYTILISGISPVCLALLAFLKEILLHASKCLIKRGKTGIQEFKNLLRIHKNISWLSKEFFMHLSILFMNLYPPLLLNMFKVFGCKKLDITTEKYLTEIPWVRCESSFHKSLRLVSLIFIFIWGVIYPFILVIFVRRQISLRSNKVFHQINKEKNDKSSGLNQLKMKSAFKNENVIVNYFIQGYKTEYYWWELSVFSRKILFFCMASFSEEMDGAALGGLAIYLLTFFLLKTLYYKPYVNPWLNVLEVFSLLVSISSINMGLISSFGQEVSDNLKSFSIICLSIANFVFISISFLFYFKTVLRQLIYKIGSYFKIKNLKIIGVDEKLKRGNFTKSNTKKQVFKPRLSLDPI